VEASQLENSYAGQHLAQCHQNECHRPDVRPRDAVLDGELCHGSLSPVGGVDRKGEAGRHAGDPEESGQETGASEQGAVACPPHASGHTAEDSESSAGRDQDPNEDDIVCRHRDGTQIGERSDGDEPDRAAVRGRASANIRWRVRKALFIDFSSRLRFVGPVLVDLCGCGSGVAVRHPDRGSCQSDGGIDAEDHNGSAWLQESRRVVDRDGGLECGPGHVLAKAGRKQLAEW
jgi:hypothetical protein